jgi:hypothetical protein
MAPFKLAKQYVDGDLLSELAAGSRQINVDL